ncbi:MAG: hypothetical protein ACI8W8_001473, partial [Rhodothermales bacterium]
ANSAAGGSSKGLSNTDTDASSPSLASIQPESVAESSAGTGDAGTIGTTGGVTNDSIQGSGTVDPGATGESTNQSTKGLGESRSGGTGEATAQISQSGGDSSNQLSATQSQETLSDSDSVGTTNATDDTFAATTAITDAQARAARQAAFKRRALIEAAAYEAATSLPLLLATDGKSATVKASGTLSAAIALIDPDHKLSLAEAMVGILAEYDAQLRTGA